MLGKNLFNEEKISRTNNVDKQLAYIKEEVQISKEKNRHTIPIIEARHAEEELGRRKQDERERTSADKQLAKIKHELRVFKQKARGAWEELGRRGKRI